MLLQERHDRLQCGARCHRHRVAVCAGRQRREGHTPAVVGDGNFQAILIRTGKLLLLALLAAAPERTHGMNNVTGGEIAGACNDRRACRTTLGMSDAFLLQGQLHALGRLLGLDIVSAWTAANVGTYLLGAIGVAALSGLILRPIAFRCAKSSRS